MDGDRRKFLKTALLAAGASALTGATADENPPTGSPKRFIFIRFCNGQRPNELVLPTLSEKDKAKESNKEVLEVDLEHHELQPWMNELVPYKKNLTILQGMSAMMNTNGHASNQSVMGCFKCMGNESQIKRTTVDFELAKLFPSPFGHVELALVGGGGSGFSTGLQQGHAAPGPFQRNYCYTDPESALNELFKCVSDPAVAARENRRLAFMYEQEAPIARDLKGFERLKLTNILDSLDAIKVRNKKVAEKAELIKKYMPTLDPVHIDGGAHANSPQKMQAMTDILVAALATGLTNVVLFTIDNLTTPILGLPGNESDHIGLHAIGHNVGFSGLPADEIREKIRVLHLKQISAIVSKLKQIPEGKGSMFDNTMIMYFPENGEKHHGSGSESPWIVLSGDNCRLNIAGRYIRLPFHGKEGHKTLGNWYTTLLNAHGNPIPHYGDLDTEMSRLKLPQTGPIKQLMV